jgi:hypothetical protein
MQAHVEFEREYNVDVRYLAGEGHGRRYLRLDFFIELDDRTIILERILRRWRVLRRTKEGKSQKERFLERIDGICPPRRKLWTDTFSRCALVDNFESRDKMEFE